MSVLIAQLIARYIIRFQFDLLLELLLNTCNVSPFPVIKQHLYNFLSWSQIIHTAKKVIQYDQENNWTSSFLYSLAPFSINNA